MTTLEELKSKQNNLFIDTAYGESISPTGNLAGDQTGFEIRARDYYVPSNGNRWGKLYRIIGKDGVEDRSYAEQLARMAEMGCCNGFVGYETGIKRNTYLAELEKNAFVVDKVNIVCDTDCSAFVYANLKSVTGYEYPNVEVENSPFNTSATPPSPVVRNFDYIFQYALPRLGYIIETYTVETESGSEFYSSSIYDSLAVTTDNITAYVGSEYIAYLNADTNLLRGDILRTVVPWQYGHVATWT